MRSANAEDTGAARALSLDTWASPNHIANHSGRYVVAGDN